MSRNYVLIGKRWLRKYTSSKATPVYAAESDVSRLANSLCDVKWQRVAPKDAVMTYHTSDAVYYADPVEKTGGISGLNYNVMIRDEFDAALFCGHHVSETHLVYGNAACYKFALPDMQTYPTLERLKVDVTSDPYNSTGARIAVYTNSTGDIPTDCLTCRTGSAPSQSHSCTRTGNAWTTNDTYADSVAPRAARDVTSGGKTTTNWYPVNGTCEFVPTGGLQLQKYLFVFVLLENYNVCRGNWVEGCSFIENRVMLQTSGDVTGWEDGSEVDLSNDSVGSGEIGTSSVSVVKDGVVPDVSGESSPFVGTTVLDSGTVPRMLDGKIASVLPQVTDETSSGNLCAGISTAVGLLAEGKAETAAIGTTNPTFRGFGAGYCIHHSSDLKFVDRSGNEANPKSLCVTAASLMVPFGLDSGVEMGYAKFDWSTWLLGTVTPYGARLNFWMKVGSFEREYPDLTKASFYRADEDSVDGWKLVASENVSSGSVTVDLSQAIGRVASGNNTFLVTAYVPASSVDTSETSDFSRGVGAFWYNFVTPDSSLGIDIDLYPAFDSSASYRKDSEVSYGTNELKEWNVCSGTAGVRYVKTTKSANRRLAFGSDGIRYSHDGIVWRTSNVTVSAESLKMVFEKDTISVAVIGSSVYATATGYGQRDGSRWGTLKNLGSVATCADRLAKGALVGTVSGAYRMSSGGYLAADWSAVTMPSVPVRAVSVIPNSNVFSTDSQLFATDKCIYHTVGAGGDLAIASLPTSLKYTYGASGSGASRVFTDSGFFTKMSDVWLWNPLTGDVRFVNSSSSPWIACVDNGLAYSADGGASWTMSAASGKFLGVAYNNGVWVATGEGVMSWSLDGMTWNAVDGVEGTCDLAIHVDPYWYAGFSGGKAFASETGRDWTAVEFSEMPNGVYGMYETDQGDRSRMGVVCSGNGLFRTVLGDSSLFFYRPCASMWWYGNTWSGDYGSRTEMTWPFYDACCLTTQANGRHLIAASSSGLFSINLANDGYMNWAWVQVKDSVTMGSVLQVMPGGKSPSTYMLARASDGTVYRYGMDINTHSLTAVRHLDTTASNIWQYMFRPINGKWINASYGRHAIGASNKLSVSVNYGYQYTGNLASSGSNPSIPTDKDGYFVIYGNDGTAHRFKIVDTTTSGGTCSVSNLQLQLAADDTWEASMFTRSDTPQAFTSSDGLFYPAGVRWVLSNQSYSRTTFYIYWYVRFNEARTSMSPWYYIAGLGYTVDPSETDGSFAFYSADGDALTATFDSSTKKLTVMEGTCWRDVNTIPGGAGSVRLPAVDFLYSDSTGDYAFSKNKVYKSTDNAVTWALADTLVDHCPFVHVKSGASLCLAVDSQGNTFRSTDNGHSWIPYQATTATPRFDIVNGKWFSKGTDKTMVSDDGVTWIDTSVELAGITCIEYGGNVYACSCPSGVYRSVDGIRWTKMSDRSDVASLLYEGDRWVASSSDGILWSGDDPAFESHNVPASPVSGFSKVYKGSSYLIGCSSDMSGLWYSSDNGVTWRQSNVKTGLFYDVTSDGSTTYVAIGSGGVYYGTGMSWTKAESVDGTFLGIAYYSSTFVAVGKTGLVYSANGSTWTNPFESFTAITYGSWIGYYFNNGYVNVGLRWVAVNSSGLYYCNDASSWNKVLGTSGTFSSVSRTRNVSKSPYGSVGAYLIAYSSSQVWYAADNDVSVWTKFEGLQPYRYKKVEKTSSGWIAARFSYLFYSSDGSVWNGLSAPGVGTISDVWANERAGTEVFLVAGTLGAAWSIDCGSTWTKFSGIGAVKEIVTGPVSIFSRTAILFLASGEAYAVNLFAGQSYTPVATKLTVTGGVDTFIAVTCCEGENSLSGEYHLQTSDFTDYMVYASTDFYTGTPRYTAITGLRSKIIGITLGRGNRAVAAASDGIYTSSAVINRSYVWTKTSDNSNGFACIATSGSSARTSQKVYAAETSGKIFESSDKESTVWNVVFNGMSASLTSVAHTGSRWIVSGSKTMLSSDGTAWTDTAAGITNATAVGGSSGNLIVVNGSGYAYSSDTGSSWTPGTAISNAVKVVYLNSLWYACTETGLFTSPDMVTWTSRIGSSVVRDVVLNEGQWVATGNYGSVPSVWTSSDGLSWIRKSVSASVPMFGTTLYSVAISGSNYVVSGRAGTYVSSDLDSWTLAYHGEIPTVNAVKECGDCLVACTSQGVFYSVNGGSSWISTNLHSGNFYDAAYRKRIDLDPTDRIVVAGDIGLFKTVAQSRLTFSVTSSDMSFMSLGFTGITRGDGRKWIAVSTSGLYSCSSEQVSGWSRITDRSFRSLVRDGMTIIASGTGGIWCSQNGGENWTESSHVSEGTAYAMDGFSNVSKAGSVWIAASGDDGVFTELAEDTRIYYSKDGITWTLGEMDFGSNATSLAFQAYGTNTVTDGTRLFTGLRHYQVGQIGCGAYTNGVYYSDDSGRSWHLCDGTRGLGIRGVAYDSSTGLVYALAGVSSAASTSGIWVSSDRGKTWRHVGTSVDALYSAPFVDGAFASGYLWMFGASSSGMNLYRVKPETGPVKDIVAYRSKGELKPSQFDYDSWDVVESPVRNRLFGANTLCIPDITLYV